MILVTGGTGLVGSHLLYQLSLENDVVKAIYRKNSDLDAVKKVFEFYSEDYEALYNKISWVEADITDVYSLTIAFDDITNVYHAAALVSFNPDDYREMRKINIEGTANVVNLCISKQVTKLCYVSSIATLEKLNNKGEIDENAAWNPESNNYGYAITKYGAEIEVWRASQEGVAVVMVNPGVILGAGFWKSGTGEMFTKIYNGLKFYSEGVTGFVAVEDVVKAMLLLMKSSIKNQRYVLVSENLSFKEVFTKIAVGFNKKPPTIKVTKLLGSIGWRLDWLKSKLTGKPPLLSKQSSKSIHNKYYYSSEKIKNELGLEFKPISEVINDTCKLFKRDC